MALPTPHTSWTPLSHYRGMSTLALQIHYLFIHLYSHHSSPWTPPGPDSCLVSLTPVSPPPSTLGINHPETLISPCHFHTHSALPSHLQAGVAAFRVGGPCFSPPLSILPTKRTRSSCHGVLISSKLTPDLTSAGTPCFHASHTPKTSLVYPASNAPLQCNTCPTVTGAREHIDHPLLEGVGP